MKILVSWLPGSAKSGPVPGEATHVCACVRVCVCV